MQEQKQTQTSEPRIVRLVRTSDDLREIRFGDYESVAVAIGNQEKDGNAVARMLFQQDVNGYQIQCRRTNGIKELKIVSKPYVEVRRNEHSQEPAIKFQNSIPDSKKQSCEMPKPVKGMSIEEITEFCVQLPPGVGEEEYLRRINELGDAI